MTARHQLASDLYLYCGAVNVGILRDGNRALLIDCGGGGVSDALSALGIECVDRILCTHYHRDQVSAAYAFAATGTAIGVPAAERSLFDAVERYWQDPAHRWHLYDFRPSDLVLARSVPVHETLSEGRTIRWGAASIRVLETPGHTDGSVSYLVSIPGAPSQKRFLFCGDTIYGPGRLWDLYSLQQGQGTRDYHGFLGARAQLVASLEAMVAAQADVWVPSHGEPIDAPAPAAALLRERLSTCYDAYASISALRHYFPDLFSGLHGLPGALPVSQAIAPPDYLDHLGTTWVVHSRTGTSFAIDCGSPAVVEAIRRLQERGAMGRVEWLWVSHYHDDHVDAIPAFVGAHRCPVVADAHVAEVIEDPLAWRLPCISPARVAVDRTTRHGESWAWHEFTITAYHFPGQTLYHGALLVEGRGHRLFFAGDSFTMAGIDDYCPENRNPLGPGRGFDACLELLGRLDPDLILNCHVDQGFRFSRAQIHTMRSNLGRRVDLYRQLLPWDDPNYGLDPHWVRCHPYEQQAQLGEAAQLECVVTNYSARDHVVVCEPVPPPGWSVRPSQASSTVSAQSEGRLRFQLHVPHHAEPGLYVVPVRVTYAGKALGQFREAIVRIDRAGG